MRGNNLIYVFIALFTLVLPVFGTEGGAAGDDGEVMPLKKISLFSSGVGYFEHRAVVNGTGEAALSFSPRTINDALKSLVINDAEAALPSVRYASDLALERTLESLKINLSGQPDIAQILNSLKGTTVVLSVINRAAGALEEVRGRIVSLNTQSGGGGERPLSAPRETPAGGEESISILSNSGIRNINLSDIARISFAEKGYLKDLNYALDLISQARETSTRRLYVELPGRRRREVSVSYVIPVPVWKISYRLELKESGAPSLQAWAIVDNDGDMDWKDVELSLVSGKPVSFVQPLYSPHYLARPVLPISGAGFAEAELYESALSESEPEANADAANDMLYAYIDEVKPAQDAGTARGAMLKRAEPLAARAPAPVRGEALNETGGAPALTIDTAGEQFEFTLKKPVTLARQQSAMLPVFEGTVGARKLLVFPARKFDAARGASQVHPLVSAELTNNTNIKLPAGSITVFDSGAYAGDALLAFLPEREKRLISYGEDLSVSGGVTNSSRSSISSVKMSDGIMTVERKLVYLKSYTVKNASGENKILIIEHTKTPGTTLVEPAPLFESTPSLYRFESPLKAGELLVLDIAEERSIFEKNILADWSADTFLAYSSDGKLPEKARAALSGIYNYKLKVEEARTALREAEDRRRFLLSEEERVRANLAAAGSSTEAGKNYLSTLLSLDAEVEASTENIENARTAVKTAESEYLSYLRGIEL